MRFGEAYKSRMNENTIINSKSKIINAGKIINAAGLYADKIAKDFNFSNKYTIIHFKGIYLKYKGNNRPVKINVYPVPNLKNPFLGVHFTVTADGSVKIGPTSIPAFWRENYRAFHRFSIKEAGEILTWDSRLSFTNAFGFRSLAIEKIKKYRRTHFTKMADNLVHKLDADGFKEWGKTGIRAQLLNIKTKELVMDFVVEGDENSVHFLNAVSPAFTCSIPFSKWVVNNYTKKN